jgi:hypothetical protein
MAKDRIKEMEDAQHEDLAQHPVVPENHGRDGLGGLNKELKEEYGHSLISLFLRKSSNRLCS